MLQTKLVSVAIRAERPKRRGGFWALFYETFWFRFGINDQKRGNEGPKKDLKANLNFSPVLTNDKQEKIPSPQVQNANEAQTESKRLEIIYILLNYPNILSVTKWMPTPLTSVALWRAVGGRAAIVRQQQNLRGTWSRNKRSFQQPSG